jgi:4'-phosphopantetheinyl transferase
MKLTNDAPAADRREDKNNPHDAIECRRIYLGMLDCASTAIDEASALELLDEAEEARLRSFTRGSRRREYLAGRLMAKRIAARLLGEDAKPATVYVGEDGKPRLPGGLELGIAHSHGLVLCAVAEPAADEDAGGIGLDVELAKSRENLSSIAAFAFSERERASLTEPADPERFYALWTLKEAWLKRSGAGLAGLAEAPAFELGPGTRLRVSSADLKPESAGREFLCFRILPRGPDPGPGYLASLATGGDRRPQVALFDDRFQPPPGFALKTLFATARAARLSAR